MNKAWEEYTNENPLGIDDAISGLAEAIERIAERAFEAGRRSTTIANTGITKCPLCGSDNCETRIAIVCHNEECRYLEMSRPLQASA